MLIGNTMGYKRNTFLFGLFFAVSLFLVVSVKVNAATFNVASGTDEIANDSVCRFSEALQNIDDQAQTNTDCPAGNGNNDIIQLPAGTTTLSSGSYFNPTAPVENTYVGTSKSVKIVGSTSGRSIINGNNQFGLYVGSDGTNIELSTFNFIGPVSLGGISIVNAESAIVNDINIDGQNSCSQYGLAITDNVSSNTSVTITNTQVSNFICGPNLGPSFGVVVDNSSNGTTTLSTRNVTVNNISTSLVAVGFIFGINVLSPSSGTTTSGSMNATIENTTISNIQATNLAVGMGATSVNQSSINNVLNIAIRNATIMNILSDEGQLTPEGSQVSIPSRAYGSQAGRVDSGNVTINQTIQNMVIANSVHNGQSRACADLKFSGDEAVNYTSNGGNFVDDNSCEEVFNNSKDKNNQTGLKDTFNTVANNGGAITSITPKAGSLVIDSGVCEGSPIQDVRGVPRPQGKTCDSGAVEVQQASLAGGTGIESAQTGSKIFLETTSPGLVVSSASLIKPSENQDASYSYPLGMVGYTMDGVPTGSTQTVNVYFETTKKAKDFAGRKFLTNGSTFRGIPNATLTNDVRNDKPVVKLSYSITDGGELDLDGQANGSITDPVGLGVGRGVLAETGIASTIISVVGVIIVLGAVFTYIDYRKHKAPLIDVDKDMGQDFAKQYTFWHHLKVVTVPTARYKFTIRLEKKIDIKA